MRDTIPDPNQYFVKEYPYYTGFSSYNYPLPVIVRRYPDAYEDVTKSLPEKNVALVYRCDLCEENFDSEEELDKHMDIAAH